MTVTEPHHLPLARRILIDLGGMRMPSIAPRVSLAHVGDRSFGVHRLDLERRNQRVLGFNGLSDPPCCRS